VKWVNGNGAKDCPCGGITADVGGVGHWFAMKGGSSGAGGSGDTGRPTSAVDQVPIQPSAA
jgi:hypothetical protein